MDMEIGVLPRGSQPIKPSLAAARFSSDKLQLGYRPALFRRRTMKDGIT